jgi:ubiquinol-cytochrome c reductase core subunit 2
MLSARTTARAAASSIASTRRSLATVVENPFKIAAVDNGQPTASVTVVVKAGPRYETTPGAAHVLKFFAFKVL